MDQLKKYHIWGGSFKMATSEVVVDYVIFFPKIGKKKKKWESLLGWKLKRVAYAKIKVNKVNYMMAWSFYKEGM